jgi:hypothetical protein
MKNFNLILIYFLIILILPLENSTSKELSEIFRNRAVRKISLSDTLNKHDSLFKNLDEDFSFGSIENYDSIKQISRDSIGENHYKLKPDSAKTKKPLYYEYKDWSWTIELFAGYEVYTGELRSSFRDNVPIGLAFDVGFKDLVINFRGNSGTGKTRKNLYISGKQWNEGENIDVGLAEATFGFNLFDTKKIKFTPFAGVSLNFILPPEDDINNNPLLKDVGLQSTTTYTLGFNLDCKLVSTSVPHNSKSKIDKNYWFIRFRYGYNMPQFAENYRGFSGDFHYITIGFGAWRRGVKIRK